MRICRRPNTAAGGGDPGMRAERVATDPGCFIGVGHYLPERPWSKNAEFEKRLDTR